MDVAIDTTKAKHADDIRADKTLKPELKALAEAAVAAAGVPEGRLEVSVAVGAAEAGWLVVRVAPYKQVV